MRDTSLLNALFSRRSVRPRRLKAPGPSPDEIGTITLAGLHGPDHGQLRPWRLIHVQDREAMAEAFVAAERELRPDARANDFAKARERALNGPSLLVLVARIDNNHRAIPPQEQWVAVGAALNQMLLAAEALGYAGGIVSGRKTGTATLRNALKIQDSEHIVGFLTFGCPASPPPARPALDPAPHISEWPPFKH